MHPQDRDAFPRNGHPETLRIVVPPSDDLSCPRCSQTLIPVSCRMRCTRCGYFEDCSDGVTDR